LDFGLVEMVLHSHWLGRNSQTPHQNRPDCEIAKFGIYIPDGEFFNARYALVPFARWRGSLDFVIDTEIPEQGDG
jgi:hypothetical protein